MAKLDNSDRINNCEKLLQLLIDKNIDYRICNTYCGLPTHIIANSAIYGDVHIWPTTLEGKFYIPSTGKRGYFSSYDDLTEGLTEGLTELCILYI